MVQSFKYYVANTNAIGILLIWTKYSNFVKQNFEALQKNCTKTIVQALMFYINYENSNIERITQKNYSRPD